MELQNIRLMDRQRGSGVIKLKCKGQNLTNMPNLRRTLDHDGNADSKSS